MAETSVLENARVTHEEIEQSENALVNMLNNPPRSNAPWLRLQWELASSDVLDKLVGQHQALSESYADAQGERKEELERVAPYGDDAVMEEFYTRLGKVQDYYQRYPDRAVELQTTLAPPLLGGDGGMDLGSSRWDFSGEEMGGRFLDLYMPYETHINLSGVRRVNYLDYVTSFDTLLSDPAWVPVGAKRSEAYQRYVSGLREYLSAFLHKTRPLDDLDGIETTAAEQFERAWEAGTVPGWGAGKDPFNPSSTQADGTHEQGGIWCDACTW